MMFGKLILKTGFLTIITLLATSIAVAQRPSHVVDMQGEVKDQLGFVIVGARVNLENDGGLTRETVTDEYGRFRISEVPIGTYKLNVTAKGFAAYETTYGLHDGSRPTRLSITLYPGAINESVTVGNDSGSPLDAERAAGAQILSEQEIQA